MKCCDLKIYVNPADFSSAAEKMNIITGDPVLLRHDRRGIVRFIGEVVFSDKPGEWFGIELIGMFTLVFPVCYLLPLP